MLTSPAIWLKASRWNSGISIDDLQFTAEGVKLEICYSVPLMEEKLHRQRRMLHWDFHPSIANILQSFFGAEMLFSPIAVSSDFFTCIFSLPLSGLLNPQIWFI
jgi:hypothetical protein